MVEALLLLLSTRFPPSGQLEFSFFSKAAPETLEASRNSVRSSGCKREREERWTKQ